MGVVHSLVDRRQLRQTRPRLQERQKKECQTLVFSNSEHILYSHTSVFYN